jgi:hypothetical protein
MAGLVVIVVVVDDVYVDVVHSFVLVPAYARKVVGLDRK